MNVEVRILFNKSVYTVWLPHKMSNIDDNSIRFIVLRDVDSFGLVSKCVRLLQRKKNATASTVDRGGWTNEDGETQQVGCHLKCSQWCEHFVEWHFFTAFEKYSFTKWFIEDKEFFHWRLFHVNWDWIKSILLIANVAKMVIGRDGARCQMEEVEFLWKEWCLTHHITNHYRHFGGSSFWFMSTVFYLQQRIKQITLLSYFKYIYC